MTNPPKAKGTKGETELKNLLNAAGFWYERTAASSTYDLAQPGSIKVPQEPIEVLATRPDHGMWLMTMPLDDFMYLTVVEDKVHIEVKRYKRFAHHAIFEKKFGRRNYEPTS